MEQRGGERRGDLGKGTWRGSSSVPGCDRPTKFL